MFCLTLNCLFHRSSWKKAVTFKGKTGLSKGYHLISRFSEDIDLILDWRVLGYGINEPWEKRSNTKQDAFNKEANRKAEVFLAETFCPQVREGLSAELGLPANPPSYRLGELQEDYTAMRNMLYGEIPSFKTMIKAVGELEKEIRTL